MSIFDSLVLEFPMEEFQNDRQQTLNCALSVDFLWKQRLKIGQTLDARKSSSGNESQIAPPWRGSNFRFSHGNRYVFNGEFDSGSERTLAAWIRHASRTGFFAVAIQ